MDRERERQRRVAGLRERFAARAKTRQALLDAPTPDATRAEREARELDKLVGMAAHEGLAVEMLTPLTEERQPPQTRVESANYLLYAGAPEVARPVLEQVAKQSASGRAATRAEAAIRDFRPGKTSRLDNK